MSEKVMSTLVRKSCQH